MTLKDILEHLNELVSKEMQHSSAFNEAHNEYVHYLISNDLDQKEIKDAIEYLKANHVGNLNNSNMIEQLEEKL